MPGEGGPGRPGAAAHGEGIAGFREQIRRPLAVAGYVGLYSALGLVFVRLVVGELPTGWSVLFIVLLCLCCSAVAAGIGVNLDRALDLFRTRRAAAGASVALSVAAGIVILVALNWLSFRHHKAWDITEDRRFTLDERTLNWLQTLDARGEEMRIATFLPYEVGQYSGLPGDYRMQVEDLLGLYDEASERLSIVHVEPNAERARAIALAQELGIDAKKIEDVKETVVVKYGDRRKDVDITDIFETHPPSSFGMPGREAVFRGEDALTSAIAELLDERQRKVYFVIGHGEGSTDHGASDYSTAADALRGMNFEARDVKLAAAGGVPEDADVVVIAGPTRAIPTGGAGLDELRAIEDYLDRGGSLLVLLDNLVLNPGHSPSGIERVLAGYGVGVRQGVVAAGPETVVVDLATGRRVLNTRGWTIGLPSAFHEISKPLANQEARLFQACCLEETRAQKEGYMTWRLLEGLDESWGETDPSRSAAYDEDADLAGPTILALAVSASHEEGELAVENPAKIVVFADADFVSNQFMERPNYRHSASMSVFLNAFNWMVGRRENIGIEPKERRRRTAVITPRRRARLFWGTVLGPAVLMVVLGIVVWRMRSR
jgi:hypothetical protein